MMTMTHSSFRVEMDAIYQDIKSYSENMFIEKYVQIPKIAQIRLELLNLSLYHAGVPKSIRKIYCTTSGLIQLGLDLHESISNNQEVLEKGIRRRQLSILAGDYYSSQYYSLLSKNNLTDAVKKLAQGIKNINEAKMKLYTKSNSTFFESVDQLLDLFKLRESNLYVQFIDNLKTDELRDYWAIGLGNS